MTKKSTISFFWGGVVVRFWGDFGWLVVLRPVLINSRVWLMVVRKIFLANFLGITSQYPPGVESFGRPMYAPFFNWSAGQRCHRRRQRRRRHSWHVAYGAWGGCDGGGSVDGRDSRIVHRPQRHVCNCISHLVSHHLRRRLHFETSWPLTVAAVPPPPVAAAAVAAVPPRRLAHSQQLPPWGSQISSCPDWTWDA